MVAMSRPPRNARLIPVALAHLVSSLPSRECDRPAVPN
jgi:hypothetical protein